jgi:hypothetical protein
LVAEPLLAEPLEPVALELLLLLGPPSDLPPS